MMQYKNDIRFVGGQLYVQFEALVKIGVPEPTIKMGVLRGQDSWQMIPAPEDARARLIAYEPLRPKYKELVQDKYGCPYQYVKLSFFNVMVPPLSDEPKKVIESYVLPSGQRLSQKEQAKYKKAVRFLDYLAKLPRLCKMIVKDWGFDNAADFWKTARLFIKENKIGLPASARLEQKMRDYKDYGAAVVIHQGRYGNKNGIKIDEIQQDILVELMCDPRKFSMAEVHRQFLVIAEDEGWDHLTSITYEAVYRHIQNLRGRWEKERHGDKWFMLNRELVINQRKASAPNVEWQIDGTPAALWYYNLETKNLEKIYTVSVMDSHSQAIIGYAFGRTETTQLVAEALKMAIQIQGAIPYQIKSDKGSAMTSGETQNLLKNLDINFVPTATGRARAKSIEIAQRWWMQLDSVYYHNRSGMNISATTQDSKINPEAAKAKLKSFPTTYKEVMGQIRESIHLYNNRKRKDGSSPSEKQRNEQPKKRVFKAENLLEHFGMFRKKGKKLRTYRFSAEGLEMQIRKQQFRYLPPVDVAAFINEHSNLTEFYVKYDPTDLEEIALYTLPLGAEETESELRFHSYAVLKQLAPQVAMEGTEDELSTLSSYRKVQKEQHRKVESQAEKRRKRIAQISLLSGGIELKDVRKDELNEAKLEMERFAILGFGEEGMAEDVREEQAKESQKEEKRIISINHYLDRYED